MRREPHVRFCERAVVKFRRATHLIVGFQHESDAQRFLNEMRERLREFTVSLHPEKTRLIEFGRFAAGRRKRRGLGKPETFNSWASPLSAEKPERGNSRSNGKPPIVSRPGPSAIFGK
jgi:RNA-directed DNA polymerase